ncbi:ead/Ea22-like family protein [Klebsiella michiganensis]|uniref:ead/Ea22-like family protein n=1 Tax=Klebsiella michiganensis TaxID=1134687 RepID=UPI003B23C582
MTDITELAQSLKAAAEKSGIEQWVNNRGEVNTADYEVDGVVLIDHICDCEIIGTESPRAELIALANPANIRALVEALEKAQKRITQLESRTVKLPSAVAVADWMVGIDVYEADLVLALLADAGIKWEAE